MDAIVNVALSIFAIIALGYVTGRLGVLGEDSANALNRYVFYIALPPAMFIFTARADIREILNWPFMGAVVLGMLATAAIAGASARVVFRTDARRAVFHAFVATFANVGYMGIPFFLTAFGGERVLPAIVAGLVGGIPSMIAIMTVLEATRGGAGGLSRALGKLLFRKPFLIATVLGIAFSRFALPVPAAAGTMLDMLALTAGPTALYALGLSLVGQPIMGDAREVSWLTFLKLVVQPAMAFLAVRLVFDMDPFWAMSAVILGAMPVGSTAFVLAQQYGVAIRLASASVAVTTAGSIVTLTALMAWFDLT
jgi:malonate transporter